MGDFLAARGRRGGWQRAARARRRHRRELGGGCPRRRGVLVDPGAAATTARRWWVPLSASDGSSARRRGHQGVGRVSAAAPGEQSRRDAGCGAGSSGMDPRDQRARHGPDRLVAAVVDHSHRAGGRRGGAGWRAGQSRRAAGARRGHGLGADLAVSGHVQPRRCRDPRRRAGGCSLGLLNRGRERT